MLRLITALFCSEDNHAMVEAWVSMDVIGVLRRIVTNGVARIH